MDKSKQEFEKCFPDFINNEAIHTVWQHAWEASRKVALDECRERIKRMREND
jgi:hypothetical protein